MRQCLRLHLKKVFKDYLKEFGAEEVEEEVIGQLGHSRGDAIQGLVRLVRLGDGVAIYTIVIKIWWRLGVVVSKDLSNYLYNVSRCFWNILIPKVGI